MSTLDFALLLAALVTTLVAPSRRAVAATAVLAVAQCWREGFYWQFAPLYLLLLVLTVWPGPPTRWMRAGRVLLALLAIGPWLIVVPVPSLPRPQGPHAVGTQIFRWVDTTRAESATSATDDRHNVIVQAWYPAGAGQHRDGAPYIDGLGRLPRFVSLLPRFVMASYDRIQSHAVAGATPAAGRWPVIIFSPGYGAPRAFYTGMVADLASRGFVVLAVDHPYESALTQLADGRLATMIERMLPEDHDRTALMARQLSVRAADLRFVLDRTADQAWIGALHDHMDRSRIAAVGHSFGGATSMLAAADDPRVIAAANIDGTPYGSLLERRIARPLLLLESDLAGTGHSPRYLDGNARLLSNASAPAYRFEIRAANHYSFTDVPFVFAPPARRAISWWLGGTRDAADTQRATADILVAFLVTSFGATQDNVEATALRHVGVRGGRLAPREARPAPAGR